MGDYSSLYKYEKFEIIGDELVPLGIFSVDGDGTMPLVVKEECDVECGCPQPIYRWIQTEDTVCIEVITRTTTGTPYCNGYDKYVDVTTEESIDSGETWEFVSSSSTLVEADSPDCGYVPPTPTQYRWTPCGTTCDNANKYQNNIKEQSTDGGTTWTVVIPEEYSASTLVEQDSYDCGYRTSTTSSSTYCNGDDLYVDVYYRVSRDTGTTWVTASTTPTLVEAGGCATPASPKFTLTLNDSSVVSAECDSTSAVTNGEVSSQYSGSVVSAVIGDCVTTIGSYAFSNCSSLTSVTMPNTVTLLNSDAFSHSGLLTLNIPNSVETIRNYAVYDCLSLTSVTIGTGVTTIGARAFKRSSNLQSIYVLATTPPTLGSNAFDGTNNCPIYVPCESVSAYQAATNWSTYASRIEGIPPCGQPTPTRGKFTLTLSDSSVVSAECDSTSAITSGEVATQYSGRVVSAEIGDCVTTIGDYAFYDCSGLTSVTIPNSVTTIVDGAFLDCRSLTSVTIPDSVTSIGIQAFCNCTSLTSVTIPDSVTSIGQYTFRDCTGLTSVNIPTGITSISRGVFYDCRSLTSITIPDSVTNIDHQAFRSCSGLTSITIPSGVTSIGMYAFQHCTSLTNVTVNATTPPTLGNSAFDNTNNCPIYVPSASVNAYKSAWSAYASRIQAIP